MIAYALTDEAEADLRSIIRYTRKTWGADRVRRYVGLLERSMAQLAAGEGAFRELGNIHPALRMAHCEHHYLFCLPRDDAPALIVALLHERMDVLMRLIGRL